MDLEKITVYLQPIKKLDNRELNKKFEALMRYPVADNKIEFPERLLSELDDANRFQATIKVLDQVLSILKQNEGTVISINITFQDIEEESFRSLLVEKIRESNVGDRLIIEFVEEKELKDKKIVSSFISDANELGCKFALDDFGKGYATFDPLLNYKFDILKLDRVLVRDFTEDSKKFFILEMLIDMCTRLNIETVAEYIETQEMYDSVKFIGCTYAQGYYKKELGEALPINKCGLLT